MSQTQFRGINGKADNSKASVVQQDYYQLFTVIVDYFLHRFENDIARRSGQFVKWKIFD